jgi:hypothetical protein
MTETMAQSIAAARSESNNASIADATDDRWVLTGICVGMDTSRGIHKSFISWCANKLHAEPPDSACCA